jgi:hypothetical protein
MKVVRMPNKFLLVSWTISTDGLLFRLGLQLRLCVCVVAGDAEQAFERQMPVD